jgi:hypothetical protein
MHRRPVIDPQPQASILAGRIAPRETLAANARQKRRVRNVLRDREWTRRRGASLAMWRDDPGRLLSSCGA